MANEMAPLEQFPPEVLELIPEAIRLVNTSFGEVVSITTAVGRSPESGEGVVELRVILRGDILVIIEQYALYQEEWSKLSDQETREKVVLIYDLEG